MEQYKKDLTTFAINFIETHWDVIEASWPYDDLKIYTKKSFITLIATDFNIACFVIGDMMVYGTDWDYLKAHYINTPDCDLLKIMGRLYRWDEIQNILVPYTENIHILLEHDIINRIEVIDENGRAYTNYNVSKANISVQDDGKTLKIIC